MRLTLLEGGQLIPVERLTTTEELKTVVELARKLIAECEVRLKSSTSGPVKKPAEQTARPPYMT